MKTSHIVGLALLSFSAFGAMAQDIDNTPTPFVSMHSRADVAAEVQMLRQNGQWSRAGELDSQRPVQQYGAPLSRQQVLQELNTARANHQLSRVGDLM